MNNKIDPLREPMPIGSRPVSGAPSTAFKPASYLNRFHELISEECYENELIVYGRVTDEFGVPLKNAVVEMWHSTQFGLYGLETDPSPVPVDPVAQGWMFVTTDNAGMYCFRTEKREPENIGRVPHLHLKVSDRGAILGLSQLYYAPTQEDELDPELLELPFEERLQCIANEEEGLCRFDLVV